MSALAPRMIEAVRNIERSFYLLASQAPGITIGSPLKNESELKFFSIKTLQPKPASSATAPTDKSVEDILAPIVETPLPKAPTSPLDLPKPTQENWLQDDNAPSGLKNLPKPSNDADWLQDF